MKKNFIFAALVAIAAFSSNAQNDVATRPAESWPVESWPGAEVASWPTQSWPVTEAAARPTESWPVESWPVA